MEADLGCRTRNLGIRALQGVNVLLVHRSKWVAVGAFSEKVGEQRHENVLREAARVLADSALSDAWQLNTGLRLIA